MALIQDTTVAGSSLIDYATALVPIEAIDAGALGCSHNSPDGHALFSTHGTAKLRQSQCKPCHENKGQPFIYENAPTTRHLFLVSIALNFLDTETRTWEQGTTCHLPTQACHSISSRGNQTHRGSGSKMTQWKEYGKGVQRRQDVFTAKTGSCQSYTLRTPKVIPAEELGLPILVYCSEYF